VVRISRNSLWSTAWLDLDAEPVIFSQDGLFPSHSGVWSISAYRENFYVHNPIERYGITSGMPLYYNPDGSLDMPFR
jgi:hypothetical protein